MQRITNYIQIMFYDYSIYLDAIHIFKSSKHYNTVEHLKDFCQTKGMCNSRYTISQFKGLFSIIHCESKLELYFYFHEMLLKVCLDCQIISFVNVWWMKCQHARFFSKYLKRRKASQNIMGINNMLFFGWPGLHSKMKSLKIT